MGLELRWVPSHGKKEEWEADGPFITSDVREANDLADTACTKEMEDHEERVGPVRGNWRAALKRKQEWAKEAHGKARLINVWYEECMAGGPMAMAEFSQPHPTLP